SGSGTPDHGQVCGVDVGTAPRGDVHGKYNSHVSSCHHSNADRRQAKSFARYGLHPCDQIKWISRVISVSITTVDMIQISSAIPISSTEVRDRSKARGLVGVSHLSPPMLRCSFPRRPLEQRLGDSGPVSVNIPQILILWLRSA